jgi:hypothetical protein
MNKHTPGEWIGKATGAGQGLIYAEKDGRNVAVAYHARDTDLIAAAPDMLEALKNILPHLDEYIKWHHEFDGGCSVEIEDGTDIIRAAIAKAEGGQK